MALRMMSADETDAFGMVKKEPKTPIKGVLDKQPAPKIKTEKGCLKNVSGPANSAKGDQKTGNSKPSHKPPKKRQKMTARPVPIAPAGQGCIKPPLVSNVVYTSERVKRCSFPGCNYASMFKKEIRQHETQAHPESRKCSFCDHLAPSQKELVIHVHRYHAKKNDLSCDQCGYRGVNAARLLTHQRLAHNFLATQDVKHLVCHEEDAAGVRCTARFGFLSQLRCHLTEQHGIRPAAIKLTTGFKTVEEFMTWKAAYERESQTRYRLVARPLRWDRPATYVCCRSGRGSEAASRLHLYENRGFRCTSTLRATESSAGRVRITLYPYHYGHDRECPESDSEDEAAVTETVTETEDTAEVETESDGSEECDDVGGVGMSRPNMDMDVCDDDIDGNASGEAEEPGSQNEPSGRVCRLLEVKNECDGGEREEDGTADEEGMEGDETLDGEELEEDGSANGAAEGDGAVQEEDEEAGCADEDAVGEDGAEYVLLKNGAAAAAGAGRRAATRKRPLQGEVAIVLTPKKPKTALADPSPSQESGRGTGRGSRSSPRVTRAVGRPVRVVRRPARLQ
ncbi:uncharacterized protein LOC122380386 isoform X2 [Amphibalanus amphitrite]|uniref:uncharacterized protein LOC122380386 isoform X2 n=1 Tax=Amphibalanus amphitrite TaxID=1232801 RepID=UPI001C919A47|nr:uncharacterized protein LOC122380386 isoform X2 [Amphibalanus amphitrite]